MLKEQARALFYGVFTIDLVLVSIAFVAAWWLRAEVLPVLGLVDGGFYELATYAPFLAVALVLWGTLLLTSGRYRSHRTVALLDEAWEIAKVCLMGTAFLLLAVYVLRLDARLLDGDEMSRGFALIFGFLCFLLLLAEKLTLRILSRYARSHGYNYRTVILVGTNAGAIDLADSIRAHRWWGYRILGLIASPNGDHQPSRVPSRYPLLGTMDDLPRIVDEQVVDDVVFCVGRRDLDAFENLFLSLHERGIRTRFALNLFPHTKARVRMEDVDGVPVMTFSTAPEKPIPLAVKRLIDVALSLVLMVLALPIVALVAAAVKLSSKGAVLYRQERCGLNGRRFVLYKFRSMVEDAEDRRQELLHLNTQGGPWFKVPGDPRVTPVGRILRRFSLDELPQLWNVLRGEMSLVGPRPGRPDEVQAYEPRHRRRMSMKPGLTGLWQVSGRNQVTEFDDAVALDNQYIDNWSVWLDFKIMLKTIPVVLSGRGAH